jgi:hypothetical protein
MPDYDDLCDELTYDELTDGLSTCSGSVNDLLDQLGVEDSRQNGCQVTEYIQYTCTYSFFDVHIRVSTPCMAMYKPALVYLYIFKYVH